MSDTSQGDGWWVASDGKWYAPELHPDYVPPAGAAAPSGPPLTPPVDSPPSMVGDPTTATTTATASGGDGGGNRMPWIFAGIAALLLAGAAAFVVLGGDDDDPQALDADQADVGDDDAVATDDPSPDFDFSDPEFSDFPFSDGVLPDDVFSDFSDDFFTDGFFSDFSDDFLSDFSDDFFSDFSDDFFSDFSDSPFNSEPTETPNPAPPGETACRFIEIDFADDIQVELTFTSATSEITDVQVNVELYDANGALFSDRTEYVEAAAPGELFRIDHDSLAEFPDGTDADNFSCAITSIEPSSFPSQLTTPSAGDACRVTSIDGFNDVQVEITATNPFGEATDVGITYVLRRDGERFGGSSLFWDEMTVGETRTEAWDTLIDAPAGATADQLECAILGASDFG